jgi:nitroreductase
MIKTLKKFARRCLNYSGSYLEYSSDARRFRHACTAFAPPKTKEQWIALLTIDYHRIEKGMSLPEARASFGQDVIARLLMNTPKYIERFSRDSLTDVVVNSLSAYVAHNKSKGQETPSVAAFLESYHQVAPVQHTDGGLAIVTSKGIIQRSSINSEDFFFSRHSVRQFRDVPVSKELIEAAVRLAGKTPSVCNRQSGRAYFTTDKETIAKALSFQNGNRGFGHTVPALFVICSEFAIFEKVAERNQGWIDGGLFAMSLVYALHSLGLGSCMLNWSVLTKRDNALRAAFDIPGSHGVICMLAVGHLPNEFVVAQSPRRPVEDFLRPLSQRL